MPSPTDSRTIVCLKWGTRYGAEYVNRLYRGVARNMHGGFNFVCFTEDANGIENTDGKNPKVQIRDIDSLAAADHMRRNIWLKLALPHPDSGLIGRCLFLDLDLVILGSLNEFFSYPGEFVIIHNWIERRKLIFRSQPDIGNSSVFRFDINEGSGLREPLEKYLADPQSALRDFPTEQAFLTHAVGERKKYWPAKWVRSFKYHCRPIFPLNWMMTPRLPGDAKILVFHGHPDPDEAISGCKGSWNQHTLPCLEIARYWR